MEARPEEGVEEFYELGPGVLPFPFFFFFFKWWRNDLTSPVRRFAPFAFTAYVTFRSIQ